MALTDRSDGMLIPVAKPPTRPSRLIPVNERDSMRNDGVSLRRKPAAHGQCSVLTSTFRANSESVGWRLKHVFHPVDPQADDQVGHSGRAPIADPSPSRT